MWEVYVNMEEGHKAIKKRVKKINKKSTFNSILDDSMLNEKEKQMMRMYYIEQKSLDFIADELGYSKAGILKMHKRALNKLEDLV